jgi:ATP-dependent RNA helicase RhlE
MAGVKSLGFETPTPIQAKAIPSVLVGRDLLGLAQTGTGKTAAFALPILHRLIGGPKGRVRVLIVAPTRELAEQIHDSFRTLGQKTGCRSVTVYGGVGMTPQVEKLRNGPQIVVACPGRLLDHLRQGTIDLSGVETLVLDEADRMFDMGFLPEIRRIMKYLPKERQSLLFSATMPNDVRHLVGEVLTNYVTVEVQHSAPAATVSHALYPVAAHLKTALLLRLLKDTETDSVLVFTRTKHRAKKVSEKLEKEGFKSASIQGNLSQNKRQAALQGFRDGTYQILVATDIAARGIDVASISHVINYDMPDTADAYTHRIGRTGRAARTGDAFTLVTSEDAGLVRDVERTMGTKIERCTLADFDYSVPPPKKELEFARGPRQARPAPRAKAQPQSRGASAQPGAAPANRRGSSPHPRASASPSARADRSRSGGGWGR